MMLIYGYWTGAGDFCLGCAITRYGWRNRRAVLDYARDAGPILWRYGERRTWRRAVEMALAAGACRDESDGEIDPWTMHSAAPWRRVYCETCGEDLGIEPVCIKDDPEVYGMERCDCADCNSLEREAGR